MNIYSELTLAEKIKIGADLQIQRCVDDLQSKVESGEITESQAKSIAMQYMKSDEFQKAVMGWVAQMSAV